ncbi:hypothetical protein LCGC14_2541430, partial [marine sediment metagenome]
MFHVFKIIAISLVLAACGTTPEAELRYSAAGGTFIEPLSFQDANKKWYWSWKLHAKMFKRMIHDLFPNKHVFFGANDWGAGVVQSFITRYNNMLSGASINSPIALNGYWVQHIGSLHALTKMPYPSPTFDVEAIRFIGTFTMLLETMFHRTAKIHNQYTMSPLQEPYVEISYGDVTKNPSNTIYNSHAVRVLAEQASVILGNGELLPYDKTENPNGLRFTQWNVPILMLWGKNDKMMPEGQVHRFANIIAAIKLDRKTKGILNDRLEFKYN